MPQIPFTIRSVPFVTERGFAIPARRAFVAAQFVGRLKRSVPYPTLFDSGAAYSVVPLRLAHQIRWRDLGNQAMLGGRSHTLEWNGLPCQMGELEAELVDMQSLTRTRVLRVLAKVLSAPAPPPLEQSAILGMSFLTDNSLRLELDASGPTMSGFLTII
jgi:hypothetical protein